MSIKKYFLILSSLQGAVTCANFEVQICTSKTYANKLYINEKSMSNNFDVENFDLKNFYSILLINKIQRYDSFDVKKFDLKTKNLLYIRWIQIQNEPEIIRLVYVSSTDFTLQIKLFAKIQQIPCFVKRKKCVAQKK